MATATERKLPHSVTDEFGNPSNLQSYMRERMRIRSTVGARIFEKMPKIDINTFDAIDHSQLSSAMMKGVSRYNTVYLVLKLIDTTTREVFAVCYARGINQWAQKAGGDHIVFSTKESFGEHLASLSKLVKGTHEKYQLVGERG